MVNHAMKNETAKVTVASYLAGMVNHMKSRMVKLLTLNFSVELECGHTSEMEGREEKLRKRKDNVVVEETEIIPCTNADEEDGSMTDTSILINV